MVMVWSLYLSLFETFAPLQATKCWLFDQFSSDFSLRIYIEFFFMSRILGYGVWPQSDHNSS